MDQAGFKQAPQEPTATIQPLNIHKEPDMTLPKDHTKFDWRGEALVFSVIGVLIISIAAFVQTIKTKVSPLPEMPAETVPLVKPPAEIYEHAFVTLLDADGVPTKVTLEVMHYHRDASGRWNLHLADGRDIIWGFQAVARPE